MIKGLVLGLLLLIVSFYLWVKGVEGVEDLRRGSFSYYIYISAVMKNIPIVTPCEEPSYSEWGRDGERAPSSSLNYHTNATPSEIFLAYAPLLKNHRCIQIDHPLFKNSQEDPSLVKHYLCHSKDVNEIHIRYEPKPKECDSVNVQLDLNY